LMRVNGSAATQDMQTRKAKQKTAAGHDRTQTKSFIGGHFHRPRAAGEN
jgi:hypothetical protein